MLTLLYIDFSVEFFLCSQFMELVWIQKNYDYSAKTC